MKSPDRSRSGSSPLARGLRKRRPRRLGWCGIIPARAGFTLLPGRANHSHPDHPRSRGVYVQEVDSALHMLGSSPLARGLPRDGDLARLEMRIIPARAGFTRAASLAQARIVDHPRSRGVYRTCHCAGCHRSGSSPLARGLPSTLSDGSLRVRIIPARAGFTLPRLTAMLPR